MESVMNIPEYTQRELVLPAMGAWPASRHLFDDEQVRALRAAEAAGRPLLVRGDPGTGKSQLAHAAAVATGRALLSVVVDARSEAHDLMWHFDAVARLSDAHLAALPGGKALKSLRPVRYVAPGPLWWAFDWCGAARQLKANRCGGVEPQAPGGWAPDKGVVLLIDEIDKAESDLPNGLLEALGNGRFTVTPTGTVVERAGGVPPPLVIVTTNDERELPAAFLRRCLVLTLKLPEEDKLVGFLEERGKLHFPKLCAAFPDVPTAAAQMLIEDRKAANEAGVYKPGLAEYLDLLRALEGIGGDAGEHIKALRGFVFSKQPPA